MQISLDRAPVELLLRLGPVLKPDLGERLRRMGLYPGCILRREDAEVALSPVRVRGPHGEATLSAGMAAKVIVHHDDGHKTPVIEMLPGEEGHIEGLTAGTGLEQALCTLGLCENDRLRLLRKVPPMRYTARLGEHRRLNLTEGVAAKLWGMLDGRDIQFVNARKGHPFTVAAILGGGVARQRIEALGIRPGSLLTLEGVRPDLAVGNEGGKDRIVVTSEDGLRLYLELEQAASVIVEVADEGQVP
jgi:Fe2+ transport system protein FeoA